MASVLCWLSRQHYLFHLTNLQEYHVAAAANDKALTWTGLGKFPLKRNSAPRLRNFLVKKFLVPPQ